MAKKFTLGKNERLKSRKQIELLFSEGEKFSLTPFRIQYSYHKTTDPPLQFGVGVSNRNFKKAVDRNRIKRQVREAYRLQKSSLQQQLKEKKGQLSIFFIYNGKEILPFTEIKEKVNKVLDKLKQAVESSD